MVLRLGMADVIEEDLNFFRSRMGLLIRRRL